MFKTLSTTFLFLFPCIIFAQTQQTDSANASIINAEGYNDQMIQDAIVKYNKIFNDSITTPAQLVNKMIENYKALFGNIRLCSPGTYTYLYPVPKVEIAASTAVVQKLSDGACSVKMETNLQKNLGGMPSLDCKYDSNQLKLFTDQQAVSVIQQNFTLKANPPTAFDRMQNTQCKMSMNGQTVP